MNTALMIPWHFVIDHQPRQVVARHMRRLPRSDRRLFRDHLIFIGTYPLRQSIRKSTP